MTKLFRIIGKLTVIDKYGNRSDITRKNIKKVIWETT